MGYLDFNLELGESFSVESQLQIWCHVYHTIQLKNLDLVLSKNLYILHDEFQSSDY